MPRNLGNLGKPREWRTDLMNGKRTEIFTTRYLQLQNVRDGLIEEDPEELEKYNKCLTSEKVNRVKNDDTTIQKDDT